MPKTMTIMDNLQRLTNWDLTALSAQQAMLCLYKVCCTFNYEINEKAENVMHWRVTCKTKPMQ